MNKTLYIKRLSAALVLILFVGMSAIGSEGALLCFGKDGHIAFEFVDSCDGLDFDTQVAKAKSDECGPCSDIQFQSSPAYTCRTVQITSLQAVSFVLSVPVLSSQASEGHFGSNINLHEKSLYKTLASIQSVVLLI